MLRALLDVRHLLERAELRRLLAHIYLDDYVLWLQSVHDSKLEALARQIGRVKARKEGLFLCIELEELEQSARQHSDMLELE